MFVAPVTLAVQLSFLDRDGNTAVTSYRLLSSLSMSTLEAIAAEIEAALLPLSDAVLTKRQFVWRYVNDAAGVPSSTSDTTLYLSLLYTNSDNAKAFDIPSPREDIWASVAWGNGILLDARDPGIFSLVTAFTSAIASTVDEEGNPFEPVYLAGVKAT